MTTASPDMGPDPVSIPTTARLQRLGATLGVVGGLVWIAQAWLIADLLARLLAGAPALALQTGLGFVALGVLRAALDAGAHRALSRHADARLAALRSDIIQGEAQTTQPSALGGPGVLAALVAEKAEALRPFLLRYAPARARVMVLPPLILLITFWQSWALGLVLLLAGPLIPVFMALVGWAAKDASARQMDEIGSLSDLLVDRLAALADLRLAGGGAAVVADFARSSDRLRARTMAVLRIAFLSSTVLELFAALGVAMVAVWTGFSLLGLVEWGGAVTPATGIWLLLLAPEYFQPLRDLAAAWHDKAAAEAVEGELRLWRADRRPVIEGLSAQGTDVVGSLVLTGAVVDRGARRVLLPDLTVAPGERLAVMGPSGAGKTTLLRVLAGLEPLVEGQITVGGQALPERLGDWRAQLGWMPQAPHFLGRSLRYNIGFGDRPAAETLGQAALTEVVTTLPQGDLTLLGERGAGLSGGEARRVTLARALQARPLVLLADEPTADLDAETAEAVAQGLLSHPGTLIVATHDARLAARMDRIVTLDPQACATGGGA